ncbi:MAG: GntR family transcriptional regulator [Synergistaceae bacterium]|jgi:DNA-binding GntR family transcriptional regulator|nr:GntR family transcriptional regulator [Synergistaceae bacterium]
MAAKVFLSFGEQIYQTLKERILNNYYPPGTMLQIEKLAEEMGVSSTPVRETLVRLNSVGLVNMVRNRGAMVSAIDEKMVRDVWEFRAILEQCVAREAVPRIDPKDLHRLRDRIEYHLANPSNFELYQEIDQELHELLRDRAENDLVREALRNLVEHARRVRYFAESMPPDENILVEVSKEHLLIVDALLSGKVDDVLRTLEAHLVHGRDRTLKALSKLSQPPVVDVASSAPEIPKHRSRKVR